MLLAITDKGISLDEQSIPVSSSFFLRADAWHRYSQVERTQRGEQWLHWDPKCRELSVHTHPYGIWPLTYHVSPNLIIVSNSASEVVKYLRGQNHTIEPDRAAIWESLLIGQPLVGRTLFLDVWKARVGEELQLSLRGSFESHSRWCPRIGGEARVSEVALVQQAADILTDIFRDLAKSGSFLLPLSGGLDSRLAVAMLVRFGAKVRTFTFGSYGCIEVPMARRVAQQLGVPWQAVELLPDDYIVYGQRVVNLTGGTLSPMHMHLYCCLNQVDVEVGEKALHGYLGEHIAGDHARPATGKIVDPLAQEEFPARTWSPLSLASSMGIHLPDEVSQDLRSIASDRSQNNGDQFGREYLSLVDRQNMIAYIPAIMETILPVARPYADARYADFFLFAPGTTAGSQALP